MGSSTDVLSLWYDTWKFLLFFTFLFNPWPTWLLGKKQKQTDKIKEGKSDKKFSTGDFLE